MRSLNLLGHPLILVLIGRKGGCVAGLDLDASPHVVGGLQRSVWHTGLGFLEPHGLEVRVLAEKVDVREAGDVVVNGAFLREPADGHRVVC